MNVDTNSGTASGTSAGTATVGPAPTLVLIHDLLGSPLEFGLLSQILQVRDVRFDFLEVPGYTRANGSPRLDHRAWLAAAGAALDARRGDGEAIVLGGFGTGAALAVALAAAPRRQRVDGLALLSPTFDRDGWQRRSALRHRRLAYALGVDRFLSVVEREPYGVRNVKVRKWVARELADGLPSAVIRQKLPLRAFREAERVEAAAAAAFAALDVRTLVLHAIDDEVASFAGMQRRTDGRRNVRLIALEHSHHRITIDNDRQRVAHELADFVGAPKRTRAADPQPAARPARTRAHA